MLDVAVMSLGEPSMDVQLQAGDVLYLPRDCIFHLQPDKKKHSLHLTVAQGNRVRLDGLLACCLLGWHTIDE